MPLLDHFRPPLKNRLAWESLHAGWATRIADALNDRWLPSEYVAAEFTELHGRLEVDVATSEEAGQTGGRTAVGTIATTQPRVWTPPPPVHSAAAVFPESVEVRVMRTADGNKVVAVIEIVTPSNKDRPAERQAFAAKCAGYLASGASVVVVDVVTEKHFNLHNELAALLELGAATELPADSHLYATSYRPVLRDGHPEIDIWSHRLAVGQLLPTLPLRLIEDTFVPVELEATYTEACRRRRLI